MGGVGILAKGRLSSLGMHRADYGQVLRAVFIMDRVHCMSYIDQIYILLHMILAISALCHPIKRQKYTIITKSRTALNNTMPITSNA